MTRIILISLCSMHFSQIKAQSYYSIANASYTTSTTWSQVACASGTVSPSIPGNTVDICGSTYVTYNGTVTFGPGASASTSLTVENNATLEVTGSCTFKNGSTVDVMPGGTLIIDVDFTNNNNSTGITIDGTLIVKGNASLGNGSTVTGGGSMSVGGSSSGAGTAFGNNTGCSNCNYTSGGLPITLTAFSGKYNNDAVVLTWTTSSEINNKEFVVERSANGRDFSPIATVAGSGTTSTIRNYSTVDPAPVSGVNYYRIKQTNYDGSFTYSFTIAVYIDPAANTLKLMPNPVSTTTTMVFEEAEAQSGTITVYNYMGQEISAKAIETEKGSNSVEMDFSTLPKGVYFIMLVRNNNMLKQTFVKQ